MTKDIERDYSPYLAELLEREVISKDEFEDLVYKQEINAFHSNYLSARFVDNINFGWSSWQAAKAHEAENLKGKVVVDKKQTEDWYLDSHEGMWWDHDGIDGSLCDLDIGEVQAVEHKEYLITENDTLYATLVWDDSNDGVGTWEFFKTKEEAEKAAAYCKAKFNDEPVEAARGGNE